VFTRYHWFKEYKLYLCATTEKIILSHNVASLHQCNIEIVLDDVAYDSKKIRQAAE